MHKIDMPLVEYNYDDKELDRLLLFNGMIMYDGSNISLCILALYTQHLSGNGMDTIQPCMNSDCCQ